MNIKILIEDFENVYNSIFNKLTDLDNFSILVTGSSGMIGSYLSKFLIFLNNNKGFNNKLYFLTTRPVLFVDEISVFGLTSNIKIIEADGNLEFINKIKPNIIFHTAGITNPNQYSTMNADLFDVNVLTTVNLIKNYNNINEYLKKFIFISSYSVYGLSNEGVINESTFSRLNINSTGFDYGISKISAEFFIRSFFRGLEIEYKILRLSHSFGPGLKIESDSRIFADFIRSVLNESDIYITTPQASRVYTYLSDVVEGILIVTSQQGNQIVNIANSTNKINNLEIANLIASKYNLKVTVQENTNTDYVKSPLINAPSYDVSKLLMMGWKPKVGVLDGFTRTIDYFLNSSKVGINK